MTKLIRLTYLIINEYSQNLFNTATDKPRKCVRKSVLLPHASLLENNVYKLIYRPQLYTKAAQDGVVIYSSYDADVAKPNRKIVVLIANLIQEGWLIYKTLNGLDPESLREYALTILETALTTMVPFCDTDYPKMLGMQNL